MAEYNNDRTSLRNSQGSILLSGVAPSADLFPLLGAQPQLGRAFSVAEDHPAAAPVVVLSYETWQRHFQADPNIVGSGILHRHGAVSQSNLKLSTKSGNLCIRPFSPCSSKSLAPRPQCAPPVSRSSRSEYWQRRMRSPKLAAWTSSWP